ncbi:FHA domain-containing protein FhaB/FipA [Leucobacter chironomi]|uniref:FHA domain-containing protein FhaB/FipA n=1 Tax=Leucobacter chironomi TaxID=491918 RepID=UPI0003FE2BB2|nr:FHA domain-containing protein [Leucobacter chironomi]
MSELALLILRIGFLLLLWFFIFAIVYALRSDLFGAPVRRLRTDGNGNPVPQPSLQVTAPAAPAAQAPAAPAHPVPSAGGSGPARNLVITSGVASGTSIPLDDDILTIGRSGDSTLVIVDEYTSTYHARLARSGEEWILTDLDSTNGTRLDGTRVTRPVQVPLFTPVTIGTTTFELRP